MEHGTELMRRFHQNMSKDMPTRVFISYAHQDKILADAVVHALSKLIHNANSIWYDKRIELGDEWEPEIIKRIKESKVAVLLVSPSFLVSDFIWDHEIPALNELSNKKQIEVFVIIIRECAWEENDYIRDRQILCADKSFEDIVDEKKRKEELGKLADKIDRTLLNGR
jgi:hypothetical protein